MKQRAEFINHEGKEIYYVNYANIESTQDFLKAIKSTNKFREENIQDKKKDLLMLVDITNSYVYGDILSELKRSGKLTKPSDLSKLSF